MAHERKLAPYRAQLMARAVENGVVIVAANAPGNVSDNSGSHGQSRVVAADGNVLQEASIYDDEIVTATIQIKPGRLDRPLRELNGDWWRAGVESMMANRRRKLE
jgi:predicted amidohydrolase